jgi:hypothetical protein
VPEADLKPIDHPCAWLGGELLQRGDWLREVDTGSVEELGPVLSAIRDSLEVLMQPFYYLRHTVDTANDKPYCCQPVFSFTGGHFACNLLRVLIERAHATPELPDLTEIQVEALDYLAELADSPDRHVSFMQQPAGDRFRFS